MNIIAVTTQGQLDKALADGHTDLIVDAPDGAWLEIRHDGLVRLWGSSRAELWESSSAELWGSSRAVLRESSRAVLWGSSRAELRGSSRAELWESSRAVLWESSSAELWGSSRAVLWGSSRAVLRKYTCVHVWSKRATLTGTGHIIDMTDLDHTKLEDWLDYNNITVAEDGLLHLFKAVDDNLCSAYSRGEFAYEIGATVKPARWEDGHGCGHGIHLCPSPRHARNHFREATRFIEVTCTLEDFRCIDWSKGKAREAVVVREVDIDGAPIAESEAE